MVLFKPNFCIMNNEIEIKFRKANNNLSNKEREISFQLPEGKQVVGLEAQIAIRLKSANPSSPLTVQDLAIGILGDGSMDAEDKIISGFTKLNLKTIGSRFKICKVEIDNKKERKRKYYAMILPVGERVEPQPKKERKQTDRKQPVAYFNLTKDVEVTFSGEEQKLLDVINAKSKKETGKNADDFSRSFGDISPNMAVGLLRSVILKNIALGNLTGKSNDVLNKNLGKAKILYEKVNHKYTKRRGVRRQFYF